MLDLTPEVFDLLQKVLDLGMRKQKFDGVLPITINPLSFPARAFRWCSASGLKIALSDLAIKCTHQTR